MSAFNSNLAKHTPEFVKFVLRNQQGLRDKYHLRNLRKALGALKRPLKSMASDVAKRPIVVDASISDTQLVTVLVRSTSEIQSIHAELISDETDTNVDGITAVSRYSQNNHHYLLATLFVDQPMAIGTTIRFTADGAPVTCNVARIHSTTDATYPLIDRFLLSANSKGLRIDEGKPRKITKPRLNSVELDDEATSIIITSVDPFSQAVLTGRGSGTSVSIPSEGEYQFALNQQDLQELIPVAPARATLIDIQIASEQGGRQALVHKDPWIRTPRSVQIFSPLTIAISNWQASVRPYWTTRGHLALKVQVAN